MPNLSDLKKEKPDQKGLEEEITVAGVWECVYCGSKIEQIILPYYSNIPDICITRQCENNNLRNKRFIFIKWKIEKEKK